MTRIEKLLSYWETCMEMQMTRTEAIAYASNCCANSQEEFEKNWDMLAEALYRGTTA